MDTHSAPLPAYANPPLHPPTDTKPLTAQTLWVQSTDVTGHYRKRDFLSASTPIPDPHAVSSPSGQPPSYTSTSTPLYNVKSHSQHTSLNPKASKLPNFTIFLGGSDTDPIICTGYIHSSKLKKGIGQVQFSAQPSYDALEATREDASSNLVSGHGIVLRENGKKYIFSVDNRDLEWTHLGPGEQRPPSPPPPPPSPPPQQQQQQQTSFLSRLKAKPPKPKKLLPMPPRPTRTLQLTSYDPATGILTAVATYTELQPIRNEAWMYMPRPPEYEGGHEAKLEIHDPFFTFRGGSEQAAREVAVATLALVLECERREVQKGRNRSLLGSLMVGGAAGGV